MAGLILENRNGHTQVRATHAEIASREVHEFAKALSVLFRAMRMQKYAAGQDAWAVSAEEYFQERMKHWGAALISRVAQRVEDFEKWRPDMARLNEIASEVASGIDRDGVIVYELPRECEFWDEFLHRISVQRPTIGRYNSRTGRAVIECLPIQWSHPLLEKVVEAVGGFDMCYSQNIEHSSSAELLKWKDSFHFAYRDEVAHWKQRCIGELRKPPLERDACYFATYRAFRKPPVIQNEQVAPVGWEEFRGAAPPEILRQITRIGRGSMEGSTM